jgi:DNA-binding CsgD family transcriptional regulator
VEHWNDVSTDTGMAIDATVVCRLLNAVGSMDHTSLAKAILHLVNHHVAVANCTVMAFEAERHPRLVAVSSQTDECQMFHCATNYARQLFQHDRIQLHLRSMLAQQEVGSIAVHRQTLAQIIDAELRRLYNDTLSVVDSMAITIKTGRREWITTNLCRHRDQGPFSKAEIETILRLAPLIATSVSRHCSLETQSEGDSRSSLSDGIDELCSALTQRERQVILCILDGVTVEQIAGKLGLKPTTVITYRSRAYEKLGIRSRRELFSAVLHNRNASRSWRPMDVADSPLVYHRSDVNRYDTGTGTDRPHQ